MAVAIGMASRSAAPRQSGLYWLRLRARHGRARNTAWKEARRRGHRVDRGEQCTDTRSIHACVHVVGASRLNGISDGGRSRKSWRVFLNYFISESESDRLTGSQKQSVRQTLDFCSAYLMLHCHLATCRGRHPYSNNVFLAHTDTEASAHLCAVQMQ